MAKKATLTELRKAAKLAKETGLSVTVEGPDGTAFRIDADGVSDPVGVTERERRACDRAFGM